MRPVIDYSKQLRQKLTEAGPLTTRSRSFVRLVPRFSIALPRFGLSDTAISPRPSSWSNPPRFGRTIGTSPPRFWRPGQNKMKKTPNFSLHWTGSTRSCLYQWVRHWRPLPASDLRR